MTPSDPLYARQWHLRAIGDIERVWADYNGAGVHVVIYDRGVDYGHPDLVANYDAARHVTVGGQAVTADVNYEVAGPGHGTAVAGIIAAAANGEGVVGASWGASITGVNIFDPESLAYINAKGRAGFLEAFGQMASFDVAYTLLRDGSAGAAGLDVYEAAAQTGRGGLGTIVVQPAGNTAGDASRALPSRHTISVAAVAQDGSAEETSSHGASLLVAAPGGARSLTTTQLRPEGTTAAVYYDYFGWTSGSSAIVAAIVPLLLEANAGLGWRDINDILAMSARLTGALPGAMPLATENDAWLFNAAGDWNGGGLHFSRDYGFGLVDVLGAVRMAEAHALIGGPAATSANELLAISAPLAAPLALPDLATRSIALTVAVDLQIDQVELTLQLQHAARGSLAFWLTSPGGTTIKVLDEGDPAVLLPDKSLRIGIEAFRGEDAAGVWTLTVADTATGDQGVLDSVRLEAFGSPSGVNDVHVFTNEFADMLAYGTTRALLEDLDGGTDWINAAAVSTDILLRLDMRRGQIDGAALRMSPGTLIENVIAGDGADRIVGEEAPNVFYGMRGEDSLAGGDGNDLLHGGQGADRLLGDAGADTLVGGADRDSLFGGAGPDRFVFAPGDSAAGAGRDVIGDYEAGLDALVFLIGGGIWLDGAAFRGEVGAVRARPMGSNTLVQLDLDGDRAADLEIQLVGSHPLSAADIVFLPG